jgi:hypothetical protein
VGEKISSCFLLFPFLFLIVLLITLLFRCSKEKEKREMEKNKAVTLQNILSLLSLQRARLYEKEKREIK